jgi:hypothetical protein
MKPDPETVSLPGEEILSISRWPTNGDLIADCARLGYLRPEWYTLDATYGMGTFWTKWRPNRLVAHDLDPAKSPTGVSVDATDLPYRDGDFDAVVIDPPYKLNGTGTYSADARYGVHKSVPWQDRLETMAQMLVEANRVYNGVGFLLYKCQDQVCSGKVRWQKYMIHELAEGFDLGLVDEFSFLSYRPQPEGTRQVTARRNSSQLLVFKRGWEWKP